MKKVNIELDHFELGYLAGLVMNFGKETAISPLKQLAILAKIDKLCHELQKAK